MQRLSETTTFRDRNLLLHGADIATQRGWTGVPNFFLEIKEISVGAKLTYAMLLKYAREMDECFPVKAAWQRIWAAGSTPPLLRALHCRVLKCVGLITIKRYGQGWPNLYTVYIKALFWKKLSK